MLNLSHLTSLQVLLFCHLPSLSLVIEESNILWKKKWLFKKVQPLQIAFSSSEACCLQAKQDQLEVTATPQFSLCSEETKS